MENNHKEDPINTFTWSYMTFDDPYQVIASIFDHAHVAHYRDLISDLCLYNYLEEGYKKESLANLWWFMEGINCLLHASFVLSEYKNESPVRVGESDLMDKRLYATSGDNLTCWHCFPRFLSQSEFKNPYLVFKDFFSSQSLAEWQESIRDLIFEACIAGEEYSEQNVINIYIRVSKLFEAAHLINIREITHINGRLKYRFE